MEFSLFDKEKKIVEQAEKLIAKQECDPEEIRDFLAVFIDAFRRCYQEQKCLIRISDRLQEQLLETKKELLIKTDQLKRQATDLKALNENLALEIAARKRIEEKLRIMADRDALTKMYNRRRFLEFLEMEVKKVKRTGKALSFMILDIDNFKKVNDQFGHAVGDQVLCHFTTVVLSGIREIDVFGRLGGEEFGVILPETSKEKAFIVAERLCSMVGNSEIVLSTGNINITVSIGVAELGAEESEEQLMVRADAAMYVAKQNGRNRVEIA
ncbi:MAG TPA: GGDEF domain-containing protein [Clostridia bacterium]|nr:GGDEF domain-containing protein [Clostridia bacterium]